MVPQPLVHRLRPAGYHLVNVTLHAFDMPGPCTEPTNQVINNLLFDWIEVDYAREFRAIGDVLEFTWPDGPAALIVIAGLATLAGGALWKYTVIVRASYSQGFALPRVPQRGSGSRAAPAARITALTGSFSLAVGT